MDIVKNIRLLHTENIFYNYVFSGDTAKISDIVNAIFDDDHNNLLNVHILDNSGDTSLIQFISNFLELKSIRRSDFPKIVVIHQQNEYLTDNFVNFLEQKLNSKTVKFVFLSSNQHVIPESILKKTINFIITSSGGDDTVESTYDEKSCMKLAKSTVEKHELSKLRNQIPIEIFEQMKKSR